jgi:hypothetical protein
MLNQHASVDTFGGNKNSKSKSILDKNSGETVTTIEGEKETVDGRDKAPLILGTTTLIKLGMTVEQTNAIRDSITQYSSINNLGLKKVSYTTKSVKITNEGDIKNGSDRTVIQVPMLLDDTSKVTMKLIYKTSEDLEVFILNETNNLVYDSGIITLN